MTRFYNQERGWLDGTAEFHALCKNVCTPPCQLLEVGAGPSNGTSRFLATLGELHGLDPDPDVKRNDALTTSSVLHGDRFPYEDASFDHCISNYVVEHVADPVTHLREVARVLRPGGAYVFRTPNRYHYVAIISALTPHRVHRLLANRLRNLPGGSHDPYPTVYAMNSQSVIRSLAASTGFDVEALRLVEKEPSYAMSSRAMFLTLTAYERIVNSTPLLAGLRSNIFAVLRRPR